MVGARNLASRDSIYRDDTKAIRERHHLLSGNRRMGSNAGHADHADHAMYAGGGHGSGRGNGGGSGRENGGQHRRGGRGTNEGGVESAAAASSNGSSPKATSIRTLVGKP